MSYTGRDTGYGDYADILDVPLCGGGLACDPAPVPRLCEGAANCPRDGVIRHPDDPAILLCVACARRMRDELTKALEAQGE